MNVLVLAAGASTLPENTPLCLTEFGDKTLIEMIFERCRELEPQRVVVLLRADDARKFHLESVVNLLEERAEVILVKGDTAGAACSALLAAEFIDDDEELLILSANEWISQPYGNAIRSFRERSLDAGLLTFKSVHPRYSYVRVTGDYVTEVSEKRPISNQACAGFYWFARGRDFVEASKQMIRKDARVEGAFYIAPAMNELILQQKRIGVSSLSTREYHPVKTKAQLEHEAFLAEVPDSAKP